VFVLFIRLILCSHLVSSRRHGPDAGSARTLFRETLSSHARPPDSEVSDAISVVWGDHLGLQGVESQPRTMTRALFEETMIASEVAVAIAEGRELLRFWPFWAFSVTDVV
jgi:hypothetical protein